MITAQAVVRGTLQIALSLLFQPHGRLFIVFLVLVLVFVFKEDEGENPLCERQGPE